jgi:hypothetical protein
VGVLEVRWGIGDTVRAGGYIIFYGKGNENHQLGAGFLGLYNFLWERKRKSSVGSWIFGVI